MKPFKVVVCDDEPSIRKTLAEVLRDEHYAVDTVASGEALIDFLTTSEVGVDAIFLDVWLPGIDGVETLARIRNMGHQTPVIVISGHATLNNAVRATRLGAFDFLEKPLNLDKVILTLANALRQSRLERKERHLQAQLPAVDMIGNSATMIRLREEIDLAAPSPGRVLIFGESGSGKELAARLIHQKSDRADEAFVEMNCAAIPEELIESELFGHVKGSFTGAIDNRRGKFKLADRGTLFLDEIGDMSLTTQAKVLRVLQEQRFQSIGSTKTIQVDVRVIAATNKDLSQAIKDGTFREDLFYRLNVIPIRVPPLRERLEDIPTLCDHFVGSLSRSYGRQPIDFDADAMQAMMAYSWPGNIRELRNTVERLLIMSRKNTVTIDDLPGDLRHQEHQPIGFGQFHSLREAKDHFERQFIAYHLSLNANNITKTAESLKVERSNLHRKIKQLGINTGGGAS